MEEHAEGPRAEHTLHMTGGNDGPTREQLGRNHRHETQ